MGPKWGHILSYTTIHVGTNLVMKTIYDVCDHVLLYYKAINNEPIEASQGQVVAHHSSSSSMQRLAAYLWSLTKEQCRFGLFLWTSDLRSLLGLHKESSCVKHMGGKGYKDCFAKNIFISLLMWPAIFMDILSSKR